MSMSRRIILVASSLLIAFSGIYVPFEFVDRGSRLAAGYGWIFSPPDPDALINVRQIVVEWIGILLIAATLWLAAVPRARKAEPTDKNHVAADSSRVSHHPSDDSSMTASKGLDSRNVETHDRSEPQFEITGVGNQKPRLGKAYAAGFVVVALIAIGSFLWREVSRAAPPVASNDFCQFATNSAMLEQWLLADSSVDPLQAAQHLFGPNAKRRWTVEKAEEFADKANELRTFIAQTPQVQAAVRAWLQAMSGNSGREFTEREYLHRLLLNRCEYG